MPETIRSIGVISLGALGDAVLLTAAIGDIRAALPEARVVVLLSASNSSLAPLLPSVDEAIELPIMRPLASIGMLRRQRFDVLADFTQWPRISALITALARSRFTIGYRTQSQFRHVAFDSAVDHSTSCHELENFRALLRAIGIAPTHRPQLTIPADARTHMAARIETPYVVLHPWASGFKGWLREWPAERYVALAGAIRRLGYKVVVTGAPGDAAKAERLLAMAADAAVPIISLVGRCSLAETAACLTEARLLVAGSTGILHMGAALGVPLVGLYGPTSPLRWAPVSDKASVIVPEKVPFGYLYLGFEYPRHALNCMEAIPTDTVITAAQTLLPPIVPWEGVYKPNS